MAKPRQSGRQVKQGLTISSEPLQLFLLILLTFVAWVNSFPEELVFDDIALLASGRFSAQWDGRDASGNLLPPGLYLLRLSVDADQGEDTRQALLSIVY